MLYFVLYIVESLCLPYCYQGVLDPGITDFKLGDIMISIFMSQLWSARDYDTHLFSELLDITD